MRTAGGGGGMGKKVNTFHATGMLEQQIQRQKERWAAECHLLMIMLPPLHHTCTNRLSYVGEATASLLIPSSRTLSPLIPLREDPRPAPKQQRDFLSISSLPYPQSHGVGS